LINVSTADTFYAKILLALDDTSLTDKYRFKVAVVDFLVDLAKLKRKGSKLDALLSLKLCSLDLQLDGQRFVYF
jgi:hypothetical protein